MSTPLRCAATQLAGGATRRVARRFHSNAAVVAATMPRSRITTRESTQLSSHQPAPRRSLHTLPPRSSSVTTQTHPPPPSSPLDIAAAAAEGAPAEPVVTVMPTAQSAAAAAAVGAAATGAPGSATATAADSLPPSPPPPAPLFLRMPAVEGTGRMRLLRWHVGVGDAFSAGDVLADIDSAIAVIEFKAQSSGTMGLLRKKPGSKIAQGEIIAVQVAAPEHIPHAKEWLTHVERLARRERVERDKEEAEEEALEEIEQMKQEQEQKQAAKAAAAALAAGTQSTGNSNSTPSSTPPQGST